MARVNMAQLDPGKTIVVATGNPHKVREIEAILSPVLPGTRFVALADLGDYPDPVEDGATFRDNAYIKAAAALEETGLAQAVADDSGLCVDALDGAPGIMSARWAGEHGNDVANNDKLLAELSQVEAPARRARFHSSVVLVRREGAGETVIFGDGDCEGAIGFEPLGKGGFGYDPLFWPDDTPGRTMAQLQPDEKNAISHRFHALRNLADKL